MPTVLLKQAGLDPKTVQAARDEWLRSTAPALVNDLQEAETAVTLANQNLRETVREIRRFAGIPEQSPIKNLSQP